MQQQELRQKQIRLKGEQITTLVYVENQLFLTLFKFKEFLYKFIYHLLDVLAKIRYQCVKYTYRYRRLGKLTKAKCFIVDISLL